MARKNENLHKHTLNLNKGDMARLADMYPLAGASAVIRQLIRKFLKECDKGIKPPKLEVRDIEL